MSCAKCQRKGALEKDTWAAASDLHYTNWMPMDNVAPYNQHPPARNNNYPGVKENYSTCGKKSPGNGDYLAGVS